MTLAFTPQGWEDFQYWLETDAKISRKIGRLLEAIRRDPFEGIGQPEALKHDQSGYWSRRINGEHRIVYKVADDVIIIKQCRYHYNK